MWRLSFPNCLRASFLKSLKRKTWTTLPSLRNCGKPKHKLSIVNVHQLWMVKSILGLGDSRSQIVTNCMIFNTQNETPDYWYPFFKWRLGRFICALETCLQKYITKPFWWTAQPNHNREILQCIFLYSQQKRTAMNPVCNWMIAGPTLYKAAAPIDTKKAPRRWNFILLAKRPRICGFGNSAAGMVTGFPERRKK